MTLPALLRGALARARPWLEHRALVALLLISACGWAFAQLAGEVREGKTRSFDVAVLLALRDPGDPADPLAPGWVEEFARDVTAPGGMGVVVMVAATAAGYLWLTGRRDGTGVVLGAAASGIAVSCARSRRWPRPAASPPPAPRSTSGMPR